MRTLLLALLGAVVGFAIGMALGYCYAVRYVHNAELEGLLPVAIGMWTGFVLGGIGGGLVGRRWSAARRG
ncbi:MAG TPA: hypothetical protein VMZ22_01170 [Acidimicrobiales bacterium]|nr:hypothetical protein [Acidimicrobiales bacterium]